MKRLRLVLICSILALLVVSGAAYAQIAYNASFTTSITYQNVSDADASVLFQFYPENNGTPVEVNRTLPANAGASLFVGSLTEVSPGFNGSAVMSSDQPIVATLVQISSDTLVKNRGLSNGFSGGSSSVLLPTVLKNQFATTSRFSIQNVGSEAVNLTVNIYNAAAPSDPPIVVTHNNLPAGAAKYWDMGTLSAITPASFNGSATVTAVPSDGSGDAVIVGSAIELSTNAAANSAFEGVSGGSDTVYMATGLCNAFGASSSYAVQNVGTAAATVTLDYASGQTANAVIQPGAKNSFIACDVLPANTSTSATITAVEGSNPGNIVVIGKVFGSGNSTAWVGANGGAESVALPYVRFTEAQWTNGARQRGYLAIQNVGADLAAGEVVLHYLDLNGNEVGTHTLDALANGAKANSNARHPDVVGNAADLSEFGYIGGFGGSVVVEGPPGSELIALVRIQSNTGGGTVVGEDATGIPTN
jgi:hypothetical protein